MIHGYISLSGLNSFLIVQNFENSAHPTAHNANSTGTENPGCFACQSQKKIKLGMYNTYMVLLCVIPDTLSYDLDYLYLSVILKRS